MEFFNDVGSSADAYRPSLFELVAQEQLRDLLQPALKYVLSVFAQRYPRYLLRIVNRHEEFYAAIMFFVERHFLRTHNASFAENFYGLKRRRRPYISMERASAVVNGVPPEEKLRARELRASLTFLVVLPYLRAKARDYWEDLGGGIDPDLIDTNDGARHTRALTEQSWRGLWRRLYKAAYPWLNLTFEGWLLLYNILYLFDKTPFYRPWLAWMNVDLRRLGAEDFRLAQRAANAPRPTLPPRKGLIALLRRTPSLLFSSLKFTLPAAIFALKFLEWWYSPSSPLRSLAPPPSLPLPPPRMLAPHPQGLQIDPKAYGRCAICGKAIQNATALPSGYVFCYRCAYEAVKNEGRCPVTLLPVRMWQLRKVLV